MAASSGGFLTTDPEPLPIDEGLLERFLEAEKGVEWRPVISPPKPLKPHRTRGSTRAKVRTEADARLAYYHDETARIEQRSVGSEDVLVVTSGPVGALVLVGECARRGLPTTLEAKNAGDLAQYPEGAIEARWDQNARGRKPGLPFSDVVKLARYALV